MPIVEAGVLHEVVVVVGAPRPGPRRVVAVVGEQHRRPHVAGREAGALVMQREEDVIPAAAGRPEGVVRLLHSAP